MVTTTTVSPITSTWNDRAPGGTGTFVPANNEEVLSVGGPSGLGRINRVLLVDFEAREFQWRKRRRPAVKHESNTRWKILGRLRKYFGLDSFGGRPTGKKPRQKRERLGRLENPPGLRAYFHAHLASVAREVGDHAQRVDPVREPAPAQAITPLLPQPQQ